MGVYMLLKELKEAIKPPVFHTKPKVQELAKKHGIPSQEVLTALHGKKKCGPEYDVVKKAKI